MKDQRRGKGLHPDLFSGHVAQAKDVHEQVTNDKPSTQEGREAAGHQRERPPQGPFTTQLVHTQRLKSF